MDSTNIGSFLCTQKNLFNDAQSTYDFLSVAFTDEQKQILEFLDAQIKALGDTNIQVCYSLLSLFRIMS